MGNPYVDEVRDTIGRKDCPKCRSKTFKAEMNPEIHIVTLDPEDSALDESTQFGVKKVTCGQCGHLIYEEGKAKECNHVWEKSNNDNLLEGKEVRYCHKCKAVQMGSLHFTDVPTEDYSNVLDWILWEVGR